MKFRFHSDKLQAKDGNVVHTAAIITASNIKFDSHLGFEGAQ